MYVKEINAVKEHLDLLKTNGIIREWALPYEHLLTRLSAAIFFIEPAGDGEINIQEIENELAGFDHFSFRLNQEKKLSDLTYRVTFSPEEKEKNVNIPVPGLL